MLNRNRLFWPIFIHLSLVMITSKDSIFLTVAGIEPGLALMDEIGRRALTDAFMRFTKEAAKTHRFLYNPNQQDDSLGSPIEAGEAGTGQRDSSVK